MAEQGLIIKNIINQDPLGDTCQAIYKHSPVIVKKYNKEISEVILKNFLEFKTYFQSSENLSDEILLKLIDIVVENDQVSIIYENVDKLRFLSQIVSNKANGDQDLDFNADNDNNFWIEQIYPLITFLKKSHDFGHFHGLINPYNICFEEDYKLKVLGFGFEYKILSWISSNQFNSISNESSNLIPYLNYDALSNNHFDYQSDIYAIAVLIYSLYSGHPPYEDINAKEALELSIDLKIINSISTKKYKSLKKIINHNQDMSNGLELIDRNIYSLNAESSSKSYFITLGAVFILGALAYSYKNSSYVIKEKHYNNLATKNIDTVKEITKDINNSNNIKAIDKSLDNIVVTKKAVKDKAELIAKENINDNKVLLIPKEEKPKVIAKVNNTIDKISMNAKEQESKLVIEKNDNTLKPNSQPIINKVVKRYYKIDNSLKSSQVCSNKIINGAAKKVCNDVLKNEVKGPEYYTINLENSTQELEVTTPIRVIDYKKYCYFSKKCDYFTADANYEKSKLLGQDFAEVMSSIKKYNIYCLLTDNCSGLNNSKIKQPIIGLSKIEITNYIDWLNMVSGSKYELLENKVVLSKVENDLKKDCNLNDSSSNNLCNVIINNYQINKPDDSSDKLKTAYILVRK